MKFRIGRGLTLVVLFLTAAVGFVNGIADWPPTGTALQKSVALGVWIYAALGAVVLFGAIKRRSWAFAVALVWATVVTYVATVASFAFAGDDASWAGVIVSFLSAGAIVAAVAWGVQRLVKTGPVTALAVNRESVSRPTSAYSVDSPLRRD
jgi:hypothetical protein